MKRCLKKHTIFYDEVEGNDLVKKQLKGVDSIIIIGGDGTILNVSNIICQTSSPVLGINIGHVGFLTQIESIKDIDDCIRKIKTKDYKIEKRTLLQANIYNKNKKVSSAVAINEVVLSRNKINRVGRYKVYVDDKYFNNYSADGMIVSTPTGSTAYNLSAGGAIISPTAKALALTPICVHAFNQRGIVLDDDKEIKIVVEYNNNHVILDGREEGTLLEGDMVKIKKAKQTIKFYKFNEDIFIKNLKLKMHPM